MARQRCGWFRYAALITVVLAAIDVVALVRRQGAWV